jgi:hypothetical protein
MRANTAASARIARDCVEQQRRAEAAALSATIDREASDSRGRDRQSGWLRLRLPRNEACPLE